MATNGSSAPTYSPEYLAEYSGESLVNVAIAFAILQVLFVTLRFTAKRIARLELAIEDALVVASLILGLGICGVSIAMVRLAGVGHHEVLVYHQNPATIVVWAKLVIVQSFFYLVVVSLPKLAILCLYLRVFPQVIVKRICYLIGGIMILHMIVICVVSGMACQPIQYFWDKTLDGHCVDIAPLYQWASFPNIITGVVMLVLPLPLIWNLQMKTHVKVGLTFTFLTASIGLIASCLRFAQFAQTDPFGDGTWASVNLNIYTILEPASYLIAACLPTLRPLLGKVKEHSRLSISKPSFRSFSVSSKRGSEGRNNTGISKTTTTYVQSSPLSKEEDQMELVDSRYDRQTRGNRFATYDMV